MSGATPLFDRRQFLKASGAAFLAGLSPAGARAALSADALFASAYRGEDGRFGIATLTERGELVDRALLPDRAHGLAYSPATDRLVAFARRPGTYMMALSRRGLAEPVVVTAAEGRHFYGHGCFSPDGRLLYACENDFDARRGVIGVYDATDGFRRKGEFSSFGVGPHDLSISDDGRLLIVANGGIETHPDFGRTKLNLDRMEPSLALIGATDGRLVEKHGLPAHLSHLSTRHIDTDGKGRIWFACQYEGARDDRPPLAGSFAPGEEIRFLALPEDVTEGLALYVGAIAVNRSEGLVGLASPKGGFAVTVDMDSGRVVDRRRLASAAGIAPAPGGFALSSYDGHFRDKKLALTFDQHIAALSTRHL
ncbi:DUF1513 domain-containing protein [Gellertiella hungarica]|uniref:DUF1513 domain-containing protein n=1 Tax=Gellertiella hungarica TaxID=1572859 RepID=A0A7W6NJX6_9HYPH|nr:DUF1513 domain-containing protein [Gellertiella hungarica]MBB4063727.1 hypothetical protein [Gellertiella hungarica]